MTVICLQDDQKVIHKIYVNQPLKKLTTMSTNSMIKLTVSPAELRYILNAVRTHAASARELTTGKRDALYDKMAEVYAKRFNTAELSHVSFRASSLRAVSNEDVLKLIIHLLAVLTGHSENSIGLSTELVNIGITAMKLEILRRRINQYLRDNGYSTFIKPSEASAWETVKNVYDLTISKM
jgi:hypothetical protein